MTISPSRIAGEPTYTRGTLRHNTIKIVKELPGKIEGRYIGSASTDPVYDCRGIVPSRELQDISPRVQGELLAVESGADLGSDSIMLYVAVQFEDGLSWVRSRPLGDIIDPRTGKAWDSNLLFYSRLAS